MLPGHLARAAPPFGTLAAQDGNDDAELKLERAWLSSSIRCFVDQEIVPKGERKPAKHRLAAYRWPVAIGGVLRQLTSQGLEAFSSPATAAAAKMVLAGKMTQKFHAELETPKLLIAGQSQCGSSRNVFTCLLVHKLLFAAMLRHMV